MNAHVFRATDSCGRKVTPGHADPFPGMLSDDNYIRVELPACPERTGEILRVRLEAGDETLMDGQPLEAAVTV